MANTAKKPQVISLKKNTRKLDIDYTNVRITKLMMRALDHKLRQRIIDLLEEHPGMCVTDIYVRLRLEQTVASQHLGILRSVGVCLDEKQGKFVYYTLDYDQLDKISELVNQMASLQKAS